jgi:hypothetical protein
VVQAPTEHVLAEQSAVQYPPGKPWSSVLQERPAVQSVVVLQDSPTLPGVEPMFAQEPLAQRCVFAQSRTVLQEGAP